MPATPTTLPLACRFSAASDQGSNSTGKERDSESGNDYFGARYYASSMGRFLSPDPSGLYYADPTNPQSLNLYAYVLNNPLKFVDPTGLDCAYLNDSGDGIESLDQQSNSDECTQNGGYWADGAITNFQVNDNGSYTFTSLDANLNTLYTNFSGSSNTNSFVNLDVTSYFANYQIQQRQLQSQSLLNMPQNQRIQQLAAGITKDTNCAVNSLMKGGSTAALDAAGMVPFGGDAEMAAPVAINAVSSVNSAVQGDTTGSGLSTVNMVQGAVVNAVTSPSMGINAPKAIPVAGQAYSAGLVARDVWNASGAYANCF